MPLEHFNRGPRHTWARWRITEDESVLAHEVRPHETIPTTLSNPLKRLEFLAGRALIRALVEKEGLTFLGVAKDAFGKPFLKGLKRSISLSHSFPYVAAVIGESLPVGIDLEQPKEKLLRIAPRVLHSDELKDAGSDVVKHCVYWCAKEALIKIHGKKDLVLAENLRIAPFEKENKGEILGRIIVNSTETAIPLQYFIEESFVVVVNK